MSVPLIWIVHEDILGKRLSHYAELGWKDLINEWRNAFIRADAVVFPDFSLPVITFPFNFDTETILIFFL